ncbi:hypothetical protein P7H06_15230 [Paenibacillus larvae]|nr:hypothetical protein [Paenibacillus larvae]MDT2260579.1 hypothetical protein [Paenibacillus larvae]
MQNYSEFGVEARKIMLIKDIKMVDMAKELGVSPSLFRGNFERHPKRNEAKIQNCRDARHGE